MDRALDRVLRDCIGWFESGGRVRLRSRNDNDFSVRYPAIVKALAAVPDETVIDGEIVMLD
ncbi:MAG: hypothetical protein LAQ69_47485 [Acidobacteriia bacterium]|nr:hypothetical protein [Terriglobia bacterium]